MRGYGNSPTAVAIPTYTFLVFVIYKILTYKTISAGTLFYIMFLLLQLWMIFSFVPTITLHGIVLLCKGTAW